ncbi:unnamed protein product [Fraxinus pennsylvanica]|uniref:TRF2/HOY1 PH-like domain-containing protein n=1 Tax=Fraxinus pennsylvanica TaxID=56036 RepID=A0AAD2DNE6_9LAMI|nr:unnamed protein product [Fraxinus pennsylvanica]
MSPRDKVYDSCNKYQKLHNPDNTKTCATTAVGRGIRNHLEDSFLTPHCLAQRENQKQEDEENNEELTTCQKSFGGASENESERRLNVVTAGGRESEGMRAREMKFARSPIFFKENNPQPRKHTIWKPTSEFTGGQASINRKHFLQCPLGVLDKHYEKLIQCDKRLYILSRQLEIVIDSPYFDTCASINPEECRGHEFDRVSLAQGYSPSSFQDVELVAITQSSPSTFEQNPNHVTVENMSTKTLSSSSVMDTSAFECNGSHEGHGYLEQRSWEQLKVPDLRPSVMRDLENNIGSCLSEQVTSGCLPSDKTPEFWDVMENIKRYLLGDTYSTTVLDERSLLKKVDSLSFL